MENLEIKEEIQRLFDEQTSEVTKTLNDIAEVLKEIALEKIDPKKWCDALDSYCTLLKTEIQELSDKALEPLGLKKSKRLIKSIRLYRSLCYQEVWCRRDNGQIVFFGDLFMRGHSLSNASSGANRGHSAYWSRVALPKDIEFENFWGGHNGFFAQPKKGQTLNEESVDNDLWVWGVNTNGCLGLGNTINQDIPVQLKLSERAIDIQVGQSLNTGLQTTLMLSENGNIWGCGTNTKGELATGNTINSTTFIKSPHLQNIKSFSLASYTYSSYSCGHVLAINEDGELFVWGYNGMGALGLGHTTDPVVIPSKVSIGKKVIGVHASVWEYSGWSQMSLLLLEDKTLMGAGYNGQYQLSQSNTTNSSTFVPIYDYTDSSPVILSGVKEFISASIWGTCAALKENGDLLLWGQGEYGFGDRDTLYKGGKASVKIRGVKNFHLVNERLFTRCVVLLENGDLKAFGKNDDRGLGIGKAAHSYDFKSVLLPKGELQDFYFNVFGEEGGLNIILDDEIWACGTPYDYSINITCGTLQKQ